MNEKKEPAFVEQAKAIGNDNNKANSQKNQVKNLDYFDFQSDYYKIEPLLDNVLPQRPYCSNNLDRGLTIQTKNKAKNYKYIQINDLFIKSLIIDIDHDESATMWLDYGTTTPNWITINENNGHSHYCWLLTNPIPITTNAHKKPIEYFRSIRYSISKLFNGDFAYTGLITKNPLHSTWRTIFLANKTYTLNELTAGIDLETPAARIDTGIGRNVSLFDSVRYWCYRNIKDFRNQNDYNKWYETVFNITKSLNTFNEPLPITEVRSIAKSVSRWIWLNFNFDFSNDKFSQLQKFRRQQGIVKQSRNIKYKKIKAKELLTKGKTIKEIATNLGISYKTIARWLSSD